MDLVEYMQNLPRKVTFKEELKSFQFWKSVRTELLCTCLYILIGCGSNLNLSRSDQSDQSSTILELVQFKSALVFGSLTSVLMFISHDQIKGYNVCQLNPSVTFALLLTRDLSLFRSFCYLSAQIIASLIATAILYGLTLNVTMSDQSQLAVVSTNGHIPAANMFGFEFIASFLLVLTYLRTTDISGNVQCRSDTNETNLSENGTQLQLQLQDHSSPSTCPLVATNNCNPLGFVFVGLATVAGHFFSVRLSIELACKCTNWPPLNICNVT